MTRNQGQPDRAHPGEHNGNYTIVAATKKTKQYTLDHSIVRADGDDLKKV